MNFNRQMCDRLMVIFGLTTILVCFIAQVYFSQEKISWTVDEQRWVVMGRHIAQHGLGNQPSELSHPILFMVNQGLFQKWFSDGSVSCDVFWARMATLPGHLVCLMVFFFWGRKIHGTKGALFALAFLVFSPTWLAHTGLATTDAMLSGAVLVTLATFCLHHGKPSLLHGGLLCLALAYGMLSKFSYLLVIALLLGLTILFKGSIRSFGKRLIGVWFIPTFLALCLVNLAYGFEGTGLTLADYTMNSSLLNRLADCGLEHVPIPLPGKYVMGMDLHLGFVGDWPAFLFGHISRSGFNGYDVIAFLLKTSVPALILMAATGLTIRCRKLVFDELIVLIVACAWLIYFSFFHMVDCGVRYVLPVYPLLFLITGRIVHLPWKSPWNGTTIASGLLAAHVIISLLHFPFYISFFNLAVGGSGNGYKYLSDSNLAWNHEMKAVEDYQVEHNIDNLVFGIEKRLDLLDPYIQYRPITQREKYFPSPGTYAVWIVSLQGLLHSNPNEFLWFRLRKPDAVIGNATYIYHVGHEANDPINTLRSNLTRTRESGFDFPWTESWLGANDFMLLYPQANLPDESMNHDFVIEECDAPATNLLAIAPKTATQYLELTIFDHAGRFHKGRPVESDLDDAVLYYFPESTEIDKVIGEFRAPGQPVEKIYYVYSLGS